MSDHISFAMNDRLVKDVFNVVEQSHAGCKVVGMSTAEDTLLDGVADPQNAPL